MRFAVHVQVLRDKVTLQNKAYSEQILLKLLIEVLIKQLSPGEYPFTPTSATRGIVPDRVSVTNMFYILEQRNTLQGLERYLFIC